MSEMAIGVIVFACVFGGALLGTFLRTVLPDHHLSTDSKDTVKLGVWLIGTLAALVLGLLIASAKGSYDTRGGELTQMSANIILLDRVMARYGPETKEVRELLRRDVAQAIDRIWPENRSQPARLEPAAGWEAFFDKVHKLSPQNEAQRSLQAKALTISTQLALTRWLLVEQSGNSIPMPFLVLLVFWLAFIFVSFGLFAPKNATVMLTMFICALAFSSAIFLILELDRPFGGLIEISSAPMRDALARLGH